jgi:hypothetical protein
LSVSIEGSDDVSEEVYGCPHVGVKILLLLNCRGVVEC